jgi:AraC family transcriptional regulator
VGVHPCHLAHTFRSHYGESIGSYIRKLRITWAIGQLGGEEQSISQIAANAGFCDQAHFTREFRKQVGVTPAAYRTHVLGGPSIP